MPQGEVMRAGGNIGVEEKSLGGAGASNAEGKRCLACGGAMRPCYDELYDDRYGMPGIYSLLRCTMCNYMRTFPSLSQAELPKVYATYYPRSDVDAALVERSAFDLRTWRDRAKIWLTGVGNQGHYYAKRGMRVLDFGCGVGTSLVELKLVGAEGYGIETDANVRSVKDALGLRLHVGSLRDAPFGGIKYDLISLSQVLEHIPRPDDLLTELSLALAPGGKLIVSFPNAGSLYRSVFRRRWINWHVPYHIHHFSRRSFSAFCERNGWVVAQVRTVTPNLWTTLQLRSLVSSSHVGRASRLWRRNASDHAQKSACSVRDSIALLGRRSARVLAAILLAPLIMLTNRAIDAVGLGDSLVYVLAPRLDGPVER